MTAPREKPEGPEMMDEGELMDTIIDQVDATDDSLPSEGDHHHMAMSRDRCPVSSCTAPLEPPTGKWRSCPVHGIRITSKSFVYKNPLDNIHFERDYFERAILNNPRKAETHRFGNENSEDALTWNVFTALARRNQLSALSRSLLQVDTNEEPELYLWGLKVSLDGPVPNDQFDALCAARKVFECGISQFLTEPDIMMYVPKRFLILIEAKFTSSNTTTKPDGNDVPDEKPKSREGILRRYSADRLPTGSLRTPTKDTPLFSQLYRNLVFAIHMAKELDVQWGLVNLTSKHLPSKRASEKMSADLTTFADAVLPPESRQRFVPYTWEQLFRDHVEGKDDLHELATYLRLKSANRGKAFDI